MRRGTTSSDTRFIGAFQQTSRLQRLIERQRPCTAHAARYFELIRERLGELVADGLEEAFLVRSVRDAIRRQLESLADTGTGDRNRAEMRARIVRLADDPAEIAAFRALVIRRLS